MENRAHLSLKRVLNSNACGGITSPVCYSADVSTPIPPGCVTEKFFADTGANRSIHPNGRSQSRSIECLWKSPQLLLANLCDLRGWGKCYSPAGDLFPGFDNVVFAKTAAEKLASVGDL